jgi:hypothetical protein
MSATRPPWTLRPAAKLAELGAEVDTVAVADEVFEEELELLLEWVIVLLVLLDALDFVVEALAVMEGMESVAVEPVVLPVEDAVALAVRVPDALAIPKLGEKLMLLGLVSSMISIVYSISGAVSKCRPETLS